MIKSVILIPKAYHTIPSSYRKLSRSEWSELESIDGNTLSAGGCSRQELIGTGVQVSWCGVSDLPNQGMHGLLGDSLEAPRDREEKSARALSPAECQPP